VWRREAAMIPPACGGAAKPRADSAYFQFPETSLSPMTPARMRAMHSTRMGAAESPSRAMPSSAVPAAPMPVQTARHPARYWTAWHGFAATRARLCPNGFRLDVSHATLPLKRPPASHQKAPPDTLPNPDKPSERSIIALSCAMIEQKGAIIPCAIWPRGATLRPILSTLCKSPAYKARRQP
jgi:hypothetical protein